jgi:hypothetical protein
MNVGDVRVNGRKYWAWMIPESAMNWMTSFGVVVCQLIPDIGKCFLPLRLEKCEGRISETHNGTVHMGTLCSISFF